MYEVSNCIESDEWPQLKLYKGYFGGTSYGFTSY